MPLSVSERLHSLHNLRNLIRSREPEIYAALRADLGKPETEAYAGEIGPTLDEIESFLKNLNRWSRTRKVSTAWWRLGHLFGSSFIQPTPLGKVLVISPWNYPFQLAMIPVIGAFASGNQVILKPSEFAPATSNLLKSLIEEWRPSGDVSVQLGGRDVSESLCRQGWGMIFFTGGTETGKKIMAAASQTLTPVTLELGGKSPCFIDRSVPLEKSLRRILWGKSFNAGQTCVAPDYLLVPRSLQSDVLRISSAILSAFYVPSALESPYYGKIIHRNHFDRLRSLMSGGRIVFGGKADPESLKIEPTLLSDVDLKSPLMREEIFGPLLPLVPYDSIDGALKIIRERENPLAFYIFSNDRDVRERLLNEVNCGGVCINDTLVHLTNPELPFGGIRSSGIGAYHGSKSFEIFSHFKSVEKKSLSADLWLRYPPYKIKLNRLLKKFV